MGMLPRSGSCTPAWTCASSTDRQCQGPCGSASDACRCKAVCSDDAFVVAQTVHQAGGVRAGLASVWLVAVWRVDAEPGAQPGRSADPLDPARLVCGVGGHALACHHRNACVGALSPHAGVVRVFLRRVASAVLQLARHGVCARRHRARHCQAALYSGGVCSCAVVDGAGGDVVQSRRQGAGCPSLAALA